MRAAGALGAQHAKQPQLEERDAVRERETELRQEFDDTLAQAVRDMESRKDFELRNVKDQCNHFLALKDKEMSATTAACERKVRPHEVSLPGSHIRSHRR